MRMNEQMYVMIQHLIVWTNVCHDSTLDCMNKCMPWFNNWFYDYEYVYYKCECDCGCVDWIMYHVETYIGSGVTF